MDIQEFTNFLDSKKYRYEINDGKITITHNRGVVLGKLKSIPPFVFFNNKGYVELNSLEVVPEGTIFENKGDLQLDSAISLPPGTIFKNTGYVSMKSLEYLPDGVEFRNTIDGGSWYAKSTSVILKALKKLNENTRFMNGDSLDIGSVKEIPPNFDFGNINSLRAGSASAWEIPASVKFKDGMESFYFRDFHECYQLLSYFKTLPDQNRKQIVDVLIRRGFLPPILKKWDALHWN